MHKHKVDACKISQVADFIRDGLSTTFNSNVAHWERLR